MTNYEDRVFAVTINEACVALSLGRSSIYSLISEGKLRAIKLGRSTRIPTADLKALVEGSPAADLALAN